MLKQKMWHSKPIDAALKKRFPSMRELYDAVNRKKGKMLKDI